MTKSESKTLTDTSPKKIYTDATEAYEMLHIICLQGNVKQQWDTAMFLSEWPKSKTLIASSADMDVEQQQLSVERGTAILEGSLAISYRHTLGIYHPAIVFLGI